MQRAEFIIDAVAAFWGVTPFVLTAAAWWRWLKAKRPNDSRFIIGVSLTTLCCCEIIPFCFPIDTRWEQLRVDVIEVGALTSVVCAVVALVVLPSATLKSKWLAFTSSAMVLVFVVLFLISLSV